MVSIYVSFVTGCNVQCPETNLTKAKGLTTFSTSKDGYPLVLQSSLKKVSNTVTNRLVKIEALLLTGCYIKGTTSLTHPPPPSPFV